MQTLRTLTPKIARVFKPLLAPYRFKGARGGRGSGKSRFFGELAIAEAITSHQRFVCAREIQNSIDESVKRLLEDLIVAHGLTDWFTITEREIVCPSTDTLFVFRGLRNHTVASIKSLEGFTRLWAEEAQTISQKSIDMAVPTFRAPGSQTWWSWNPGKASDPVDVLFRENANDPDFICVEANYSDNPWFPDELRRDMERDKRRDPDKYAHVWLGQYEQRSEARVFRNWRVEEFETPANARFYHGADWGFSVDPTVLVRVFVEGRTLYIDQEAYKVGCEIDRTPELFDTIPTARQWPIKADSARPETISFMKRQGYNITPARKGPGSVREGVEFLRSFDIVVHPRCEQTVNELSTYSFKIDSKTGEILPELEDRNNNVIDAARYAVEDMQRSNAVFEADMSGLVEEPFALPPHWPRAYALAIDGASTVALWGAWDEFGICHIYGALETDRSGATLSSAVQARGDWIGGVIAPDIGQAAAADARKTLRGSGVSARPAKISMTEASVRTKQALQLGQVKLFANLDRLKTAYRTYYLGPDGEPAEENPYMTAMMTLIASGRSVARAKPIQSAGEALRPADPRAGY